MAHDQQQNPLPAPAAATVALKIDQLCVLRGPVLVIDHLSFTLDAGRFCCLTGPNGAGKSTLLRTLAGRLPATSGAFTCPVGRIYVGHADGLSPAISGRHNLASWAALYAIDAKRDTIEHALDAFDAGSFADRPIHLLSRGQRRRLALARLGLAPPNSLWLLDEPNAGLDHAADTHLDAMIAAHVSAGGMVMAATHGPLAASVPQVRLELAGNTAGASR
ncbi:MAG: heme ABC exporter ATP-binding protein CcmA [Candidatus Puniceispirillum sp.]|jgi:heme exporter protein A